MSATNKPLEGTDNGKESVVLAAISEAVVWRQPLEMCADPDAPRRSQRIIVYPKYLSKFSTILTTSTVGFDMEGARGGFPKEDFQET
jgi:hypothetical protein